MSLLLIIEDSPALLRGLTAAAAAGGGQACEPLCDVAVRPLHALLDALPDA